MVNFPQRLKDLREDKDLKQIDIAKILGTDQSYYSKWERGKYPISATNIIKLCLFYKVSADYILGFTNEKKPLPKR